jgi:hypothetical protein
MLCRCFFFDGCFIIVAAWADTLPPTSLGLRCARDAPTCGCFAALTLADAFCRCVAWSDTLPLFSSWWMLCHLGFTSYVGSLALMYFSFAGPVR